jgi:hypothetical protein
MAKKYGVKFIICKRRDMGKKIIELLNKKYWQSSINIVN